MLILFNLTQRGGFSLKRAKKIMTLALGSTLLFTSAASAAALPANYLIINDAAYELQHAITDKTAFNDFLLDALEEAGGINGLELFTVLDGVMKDAKSGGELTGAAKDAVIGSLAVMYDAANPDGQVIGEEEVDKTELAALIATAQTKVEATYTVETWNVFKAALDAAKVVNADAEATQLEVDAAVVDLTDAMAALVEKVEALAVTSVTAVTTTKLTVVLNKAVDDAAAGNFAIPGLTVTSATLGADKKTVTLVTSIAQPVTEYTLTVTGLKENAVVLPNVTKTFTTPAINALYSGTSLTYSDEDGVLKADGASSTLVTFELKDAEGTTITAAEDVVVSFASTFGNFAEKRVTVQNGKATVMFTSETLSAERTAELTGTIVEAKDSNLIGIKASKTIKLNPNPDEGPEDTAGARVTEAEAAQADRLILYFNKEVSVEKYTTVTNAVRAMDADKATCVVTTGVNNDLTGGAAVAVKGFLPVEGNTKALQVLLDVDASAANALTDNAKVKVVFTDKTGTVDVPSTVNFNLTDARKPEIVRVDREGLKTIKVTFSEPIADLETGAPSNPSILATTLNNWSIDGKLLNDASWGTAAGSGAVADVTVGTFNQTTMTDTRNVVTITLGKNAAGEQIYFPAGTHSIQGANIGDWAADTDEVNNRMNTQTLDFVIPADTEAPTATVDVQSPEQWLVTFNKDVNENAAQFATKLKLQEYNATTGAWANKAGVTYGTAEVADANLDIVVTKIDGNKFLVETDLDWTRVHNTAGTNKNYYNSQYRLAIPADSVTNPANGKKNVLENLALGGAMLIPDITSPAITVGSIIQTPGSVVGTSYQATLTEPVKLNTGANTEGNTASQSQGGPAWANIPTPTARFIKSDNSLTIPGTVAATFVAPTAPGTEYERIITVTPAITLPAGDWTLSIESISDDVGNTAATATGTFKVEGSTATDTEFNVAWAYADKDSDITDATEYDKDNAGGIGQNDAVYVKFTKPVKITGGFSSALTTTNYTLNGKALPDGTQIVANISGYDNHDNVVDSVTIILPDNTITDVETTVLNVTSFIESTDNKKLANAGEKKLSFNHNEVATVNSAATLKTALADATVRKIVLSGAFALTEDLTVTRLVDIDLNAFSIITAGFDINVNATETGRMIISNTGAAAGITGAGIVTVNAPNADFQVDAGVTVANLTVTDLYSASLENAGTITALALNDSTTVENTGIITAMTVAATKTATIDNAGTITTLTNNGTVVMEAVGTITNPIAGAGAVSAGTDAGSVSLALAALDATDLTFQTGETATTVKGNVTLPTAGADGTTITWAEKTDGSNVGAIVGSVVAITRSVADDSDDSYVLTATITKGSQSTTKDITLTVLEGKAPAVSAVAGDNGGDGESVAAAGTITITFSELLSAAAKTAVQDAIKAGVAGVAGTDLGFAWNDTTFTLTVTNNHGTTTATFAADVTANIADTLGNTATGVTVIEQ